MPRINELTVEIAEHIPNETREGVLYYSEKYGTAIHRCCCGCGLEAVTPIDRQGWQLEMKPGQKATLSPSILNRQCGAHYFIRDNRVDWC